MKRLVVTLTLGAGLCGAFVWLPDVCGQNSAPAARPARPAGASRIAYVDMRQILENYKKRADVLQQVNETLTGAQARINQMVVNGQELEKPLLDGSLVRDTPEYAQREQQVKQAATRAQTATAIAETELKQQKARAMTSIYRDILGAIRVFAEQNRYDLVLQVDREALAAGNYRTIQQTMAQAVLCRVDRDDLTGEVVAWLNKQYADSNESSRPAADPAAKSPSPSSPAPNTRKISR